MTRALTTGVLCAAMLAAPSSASAKWTRLSSEHFVFVGDASERAMRGIAQRLEQFRDVTGRLLSADVVSAPVPTVVVVFENDKSFVPFKPVFQGRPVAVAGYFIGMEDANYIAVNAEQDREAYNVIFHEYAHFLTGNAYGSTPVWVNEGLAELYETFEVTGAKTANIGQPSQQNLFLLQTASSLLPVAELTAVGHDSPLYNESDRRGLFYAESWALVHYLAFGSPAREGQLRAYLAAIAQGAFPRDAFTAAFGADTTALDRELQRYVRAYAFNTLRIELAEKLERVSTTPGQTLADTDAAGYLGDLLARLNRTDDARAYLKKAVDGSPGAGRALLSLGLLELRAGNEAVALPLLERAAAAAPTDATTLAAYGRVLARQADRGFGDEAALYEKARVALLKALDLLPANAPAMVSLADVEMGRGVDTARAVSLMRSATKASPGREEYVLMLAQAYAVNREFTKASDILGVLVARGSRQEVRDAARETLGRVATARAAVERLTAATASTADRDVGAAVSSARADTPPTAGSRGSATDTPRPTLEQGVYKLQLRPVGVGETRVQGTFEAIECRSGSIIIVFNTPGGPMRMAAPGFNDIELTTYRDVAPSGVACGPQRPAFPALATFRRDDALAASVGTPNRVVAIELVPDGFVVR